MKKISLQWRLTCIITLYIAVICGCLTLLVYKNGIYYIDSLQETVDARGDDAGDQGGNSNARIYRIRWRFCCLYVSYSSIFIPIQHFSRLI